MSFHKVELIGRRQKREYVILKGQREHFRRMVQARLYIVTSLAYSEWEQAALQRFSDPATGWRYIEGLYWEPTSQGVNVGVKPGTLADLLEDGWTELNFLPSLKTRAIMRGGKVIVPLHSPRQYFTPVQARQKIPSPGGYSTLLSKHGSDPGAVINKVSGTMITRRITNTAMGTKPLGVFINTGPPQDYRTVTVNTPAGTWKSTNGRAALLANQIASRVESLGAQFMGDLWPQVSTIDL